MTPNFECPSSYAPRKPAELTLPVGDNRAIIRGVKSKRPPSVILWVFDHNALAGQRRLNYLRHDKTT
jgi:hypothetical protein